MKKINKGYDFDDLLLVPKPSKVRSRDDVHTTCNLGKELVLDIPVIASPMKGIISTELIVKLSRMGGTGILHRFYLDMKQWQYDIETVSKDCNNFGISIGLPTYNYITEMHLVIRALDVGAKIICIDTANGYLDTLLKNCSSLKEFITNKNYDCLIMCGNVVTADGAKNLYNAGADLIRVGIGSGALCTTRNVTGVGYPQLSAIMNCNTKNRKYKIIADGGIRNSGDIVKALACGADAVMIGSLFARTKESSNNGIIYGMASRTLQEEYYHNYKSVEGIEKEVDINTTVYDIVNEIRWGIKSACTYLNAKNLNELRKNAAFIETGLGSLKEYKI